MTARTKTLALLTAGATAAGTIGATGAVAVPDRATTPGDAPAHHDRAPGKHHGDKQDLRRLAKELDVGKKELRSALREAFSESGEAALDRYAEELGASKWQLFRALEQARDAVEGATPDDGAATPQDGASSDDGEATPDDGSAATRSPGAGAPDDGRPGDDRPGVPQPDDGIQRFVKAFADALDVEPSDVTDALKPAQDAAHEAFVETLADELDRSERRVEKALDAVTPDPKPDPKPEPQPDPQPQPEPTTPTDPAPTTPTAPAPVPAG
ncbi:MAG: hypothetical protein M0P31_04155 [Solirubrobacteraceae bacterium]|nr:hypothetical protein [Solirubrobacteraceae bacterium]